MAMLEWTLALVAVVVSIIYAWRRERQYAAQVAVPRPVHEFPRTVQVLDDIDCAYLAKLYRTNVATWTQTYFNMLMRRWNGHDDRLGAIFTKVVDAANRVGGEGSDYTITNDFFSYRANNVVQFAIHGSYHTDCDFWKTPSSDGFNLWILIDHQGLNTTFEILERERNPEVYRAYDGRVPLILLPQNASDPGTAYKRTWARPSAFRRGHSDVLSWRGNLQVAGKQWKKGKFMKLGPFDVTDLNTSTVPLSLGEALVLREQELHRTDMHTAVAPGHFRLAAGFKLQRKNSTIRQFLMACTVQQDRFNIPWLWEQSGKPLADIYGVAPSSGSLVPMDFTGKVHALLASNSHSLLCIALAGVSLHSRGVRTSTAVMVTALLAATPLLFVVYVQSRFFFESREAMAGEGGRPRSTVE